MSIFDVSLHYNFSNASKQRNNYNLAQIFDGTLTKIDPIYAVTFVENHDSQPLQALESVVEDWFKPIAYALILLREAGYPCVFYADYYGAEYRDKGRDDNEYPIVMQSQKAILDLLLGARRDYAYGAQSDYLDHPNTIGWTRLGDANHPHAMAVIASNGGNGDKWMKVGKANTKFVDLTGHIDGVIITNDEGWGQFTCRGESVSVWVSES